MVSMYFVYKEQQLSFIFFFFSSRRRHTRYWRDWSSDVCSSDLHRIEPQRRSQTCTDSVMVPPHIDLCLGPHQVDHLIRTAPIPHHVPEVPKRVVRLCCGKNGIECFEVPVNVRKYQRAHAGSNGLTTNSLVYRHFPHHGNHTPHTSHVIKPPLHPITEAGGPDAKGPDAKGND